MQHISTIYISTVTKRNHPTSLLYWWERCQIKHIYRTHIRSLCCFVSQSVCFAHIFSKLLHGFAKVVNVVTWICHVVTSISHPLKKQTNLKFRQGCEVCWFFCVCWVSYWHQFPVRQFKPFPKFVFCLSKDWREFVMMKLSQFVNWVKALD